MSMIAIVVKAALSLDQKVQGLKAKGAHALASRNFTAGETVEALALVQTEDAILKLERARSARAMALIKQHKQALIELHEGVDAEIELAEGRKTQWLGKAKQHKQTSVAWQGTSIKAQVAAENARKAAAVLG